MIVTKEIRRLEHPDEEGAWFEVLVPLVAGDLEHLASARTMPELKLAAVTYALKSWSYSVPVTPDLPLLARGGPVMSGNPYIVGERGPELFVPSTSGQVVPNGQFGAAGGTVINFNGNLTVDTPEGEGPTGRAGRHRFCDGCRAALTRPHADGLRRL